MNFEQLPGWLNLESGVVVTSLALLAIVLILFLYRNQLQLRLREWRVQRCLNRIGQQQIRNLICPDGLDGYFKIDRLALTKNAIVLINYKRYGGRIYCAERIAEWTQMVGQKSFKFENPLFELENQLTSLRLLTGNAAVSGFLFFNHSASFPKGHPETILQPDNVPAKLLRANNNPVNTEIMNAWEALKSLKNAPPANNHISV